MEKKQNDFQDETDVLCLSTLFEDMWKGWKKYKVFLTALIVIAALALGAYEKCTYTPQYEAYASFTLNTGGYDNGRYDKAEESQFSKTFINVINSGVLEQPVADAVGEEILPAVITAEAVEDTALFTIRVTALEPQMAYRVLQSVLKVYPSVTDYILGDTLITLMDESGVPTQPSNSLDYLKKACMGAIAGIAISLILLFLYAITRNTVHGEEDLTALADLHCLGRIPKVKTTKKTPAPLLMDVKTKGVFLGETFRAIRTHMLREAERKEIQPKKIMVTSAAAGEGKTVVAVNLAIALSKKGKNVILVDGNLRKPSVAKMLGLESLRYGITDVLEGRAQLGDALVPSGRERLTVLSQKEVYADPTALICSEKMNKMLDELAEKADYVIVDTPPCAEVSDTIHMVRYMDGTVYVVRQDYAKTEQVVRAQEYVAETGVPVLGYVLNDMEAGMNGRHYGYGYGYGYRYKQKGYGYGPDQQQ